MDGGTNEVATIGKRCALCEYMYTFSEPPPMLDTSTFVAFILDYLQKFIKS